MCDKLYIVTTAFSYNIVSDYLKNIAYGLKKYGNVDTIFLIDNIDSNDICMDDIKNNPVIYLSYNFLKKGKKEYMLNLCQIFEYNDVKSPISVAIKKVLDCDNTIIDFSRENIRNINDMSKDGHKKILYFPYIYNPNDNIFLCNVSHVYDVCIIGTMTQRRKKIYQELLNRNVKVIYMDNVYGSKRDENICNSKILLNLHSYDEANIIESIRCYPAIFKKILVVSEKSVYDEQISINKYIMYKEYTNIVDSVIHILHNYGENYNMIYGNSEEYEKSIFQLSKIMEESVQEFICQNEN